MPVVAKGPAGFVQLAWDSTPKAFRVSSEIVGILGFAVVLLNHVVLGAALIIAMLVALMIGSVYSAYLSIEQKEQRLSMPLLVPNAPVPRIEQPWPIPMTILVVVTFLGVIGATAYEHLRPPLFVAAIPYAYWSKGSASTAAGWFAYVPSHDVVSPVNASVYIRLFNGATELWLAKYEAQALIDGQWVPLATMPDQDDGVDYYFSSNRFGVGWPMPRAMDLGIETERPIQPGGVVSGWVFFAYPKDESYVQELRIVLIDRTGYQAVAIADPTQTNLTDVHGATFPQHSRAPTAFGGKHIVRFPDIHQ